MDDGGLIKLLFFLFIVVAPLVARLIQAAGKKAEQQGKGPSTPPGARDPRLDQKTQAPSPTPVEPQFPFPRRAPRTQRNVPKPSPPLETSRRGYPAPPVSVGHTGYPVPPSREQIPAPAVRPAPKPKRKPQPSPAPEPASPWARVRAQKRSVPQPGPAAESPFMFDPDPVVNAFIASEVFTPRYLNLKQRRYPKLPLSRTR